MVIKKATFPNNNARTTKTSSKAGLGGGDTLCICHNSEAINPRNNLPSKERSAIKLCPTRWQYIEFLESRLISMNS